MPSPSRTTPLRVVLDARLVSGKAGGVESVIIGLASGLSRLDGPEEYVFAVGRQHEDWLVPYVAGPTRIAVIDWEPPVDPSVVVTTLRRGGRVGRRLATLLLRQRVDFDGLVPRFDPYIETLEPTVLHLPRQRGVLSGAPSIYHPHDLQHVHLPQFLSRKEREWRERVYSALCRHAAMVAVASEWTRQDVIRHFRLPATKVQLVPLAPPIGVEGTPTTQQRSAVRARYSLPDSYVLYPAQTWPHKNHARLLEALALLRTRGMVVPLVATGSQNSHFDTLRKVSEELGVDGQVTWTGFVPAPDLAAIYAEARAVVVPSLFEAASAPLWEAFLAGIPSACSNVTSLPDQAGAAALVFDPLRVNEIADAISALWGDETLRSRLVEAGRRQVSELSWEKTALRFRAHYRRLAGRALSDEDRALAAMAA